jgi:hypothetical protein
MRDPHFLLQNTFTGLILVGFFLCGIWLVNEQTAVALIDSIFSHWEMVAIIAFSPILGILVQGAWMFIVYIRRHPYQDEVRRQVASRIRTVLQSLDMVPDDIKRRLLALPDDSLFVWLFYSDAPQHLVEWDRRRHDFQHLGENWAAAAALGLLGGGSVGVIVAFPFAHSRLFLQGLVAVFSLVWIVGLLVLRRKMKTDVEAMELTWACARFHPEIQKRLRYRPHSSMGMQAIIGVIFAGLLGFVLGNRTRRS